MEVLEHFVEWGMRVRLADAVMDVGEKGGGDVDPNITVWDVLVIVAKSVG